MCPIIAAAAKRHSFLAFHLAASIHKVLRDRDRHLFDTVQKPGPSGLLELSSSIVIVFLFGHVSRNL